MIRYVNGIPIQMTPEEEAEFTASQPTPAERLQLLRERAVVTALQFRRALRQLGYITAVRNYIAGLSEDDQEYFQMVYEVRRLDPELETMRVALGRTHAQLDEVFLTARQL